MTLRVLLLEDNVDDAEFIHRELVSAGIFCRLERIDRLDDFKKIITQETFDLVISDYTLRGFKGSEALDLWMKKGNPAPFIFVSGTIGEEKAIEILRNGATDYVLKDHLERLGPVVRRALDEANAQAQLKKSADQIRQQASLLDLAQDAILVHDFEGRVTYWNQSASQLYGWTLEELAHQDIDFVLYRGMPQELLEAYDAMANRQDWMGELRQVTRSGREIIVQSRWTLIPEQGSTPSRIFVINTDITEKKALEAQLLQARRLEAVGTMAEGIAHDINNAVTPILMGIGLLKSESLRLESQQVLETIETGSHRIANLVRQLLAFARGSSAKKTPLELGSLVAECIDSLSITLPQNIHLVSEVPMNLCQVMGDASQLRQIFMNLGWNARDAMPNGGFLHFSVKKERLTKEQRQIHSNTSDADYMVVLVRDTGKGILPEVRDRIFEPFFTTKELGQGSGLGLSISQSIALSHGGFIEVSSQPNSGSTFEVHLPIHQFSSSQKEMEPEISVPQKDCILIADDEPELLNMVSHILKHYGYDTLTASNLRSALELFTANRGRIRTVLSDWMMPGGDGWDLLDALRQIDPSIPFILSSGITPPDEQLSDPNAPVFLAKPYSPEALLEAVEAAIAGSAVSVKK